MIPFDTVERVHQYHGYAILGDPALDEKPIVLAETLTMPLSIRDAEEIGTYIAHFEALREAAVEGAAFAKFTRNVIAQL